MIADITNAKFINLKMQIIDTYIASTSINLVICLAIKIADHPSKFI